MITSSAMTFKREKIDISVLNCENLSDLYKVGLPN